MAEEVLKLFDTSPPSPSPNYIWNACLVAISWGLGGVGGRSQSIKRPPQEHPPPAPTYPSVSLTFEKSISASDKYVWVVHKYKSTFLWVPLSCPQPIFSTPSALICHQSAALKRAVTVTIAIEKQNNLSVVLLVWIPYWKWYWCVDPAIRICFCPILNTEYQILMPLAT